MEMKLSFNYYRWFHVVISIACLSLFMELYSCKGGGSDDKEILIRSFESTEALVGEYISFERKLLLPLQVSVVDSLIVLRCEPSLDSMLFYVFHRDTHRLLGAFGKIGKGPNEFLEPEITGQQEIGKDFLGLWVYDAQRAQAQLVNLNQSIRTHQTVLEGQYSCPKSVSFGISMFVMPNHDLVGTSMRQDGRLFYYNSKELKTKWVSYFPKVIDPPIEEQGMHNLYKSATQISPDGVYIVSALYLFNRIDVFDAALNHLYSFVFPDSPKNPPFMTDPQNYFPDNLMCYYSWVFLSDEYIYALNVRMTHKQSSEGDTGYSEIQVFTREGKPVCLYKLDHFINSFSVDKKNGYLYGLTYSKDGEGTAVVRYKISLWP